MSNSLMLIVESLSYQYQESEKFFLKNINFRVEKGETLAIIGESGSGKSTLIRLIYGLLDYNHKMQKIEWNGVLLKGPSYNLIPGHSMMKYVAQDFDLIDFVSVGENVGHYISNFDLPKKHQIIDQALEAVEMQAYKAVHPKYLSGGQRQRVAIARALALRPELLLLDEPFSNIDQHLKIKIRERIYAFCKEHKMSLIFTTHDLSDAFYSSDQILVLKDGQIVQIGAVKNVRNFPKSAYVAQLFGYVALIPKEKAAALMIDAENDLVIYPEEVVLDDASDIYGTVTKVHYQGRDYICTMEVDEVEILFYSETEILPNQYLPIKIINYRTIE